MTMTLQELIQQARAEIREIGVAEASGFMEQGPTVIDVREPNEYVVGFVPDAINIPRGILEFKLDSFPQLADREKPVLVYCKSGGRSALAAQTLQRLGFSNVASLAGGFDGWIAAGKGMQKDPSTC